MQQYTEGQQLQGSDGRIYVVVNGVPSLPESAQQAQPSQGGSFTVGTPRVEKPEKPQVVQRKDGSIVQVSGGMVTELSGPVTEKPETKGGDVTAKIRADSLMAFTDAAALRRTATKLREMYQTGPGTTKGFGSVYDYLPTSANQRFDDEAQRVRGFVKRSLGFTGGEGNVLAESEALYSPYLPNTSNADGKILDKIAALEGLASDAERKATAILGGVPDQYGNISQPQQGQPAQQDNQDAPMGALPNQGGGMDGGGPQGPDTTNPIIGSGNGAPLPGGFAPYGAKTRIENDPARAGLNSEVLGMIKGGVSPAVINQHIATRGGVPASPKVLQQAIAFAAKNPKWRGVDLETREVPMSGMQQFANNAPQTRLGTVATFAGNAGGLGIPQMLAGDESFDYLRAQQPGYALAGDVAGMIGGTQLLRMGGKELTNATIKGLGNTGRQGLLGRKGGVLLNKFANKRGGEFNRQLLADASFGATYGATTQGDPVTGALSAGLGSAGGQIVGKGISNAIGGVGSKGVQYLTDKGVPLSLGQTLGNNGIIGRNLQRMEQWPVVGDMLAANGREAQDRVYDLTLQDAVAPTGRTLVGSGEDALKNAQSIKNQAYDDAYSSVNAPIDMQYLNDVAPPIRAGREIYGDMGGEFDSVVKSQLRPLFGPNRALDAASAQQFGQTVGDFASDFGGRGTAYGKIAADNMRGIGDATQDLIGRTNPGTIPKIQAANTVNARLTPIEQATITANGKTPTPLQLRRAITTNTKNYGGRAAAATGDNVPDVVRYAADILPQTIRDSGTAGNLLLPLIAPVALGGAAAGVGSLGDDPKTAGLLAVLAAMSTKTGAKALQKTLVSRSEPLKKAGALFGGRRARMIAGSSGTGLALPFFE